MKYVVQIELGAEQAPEEHMDEVGAVIATWQALNPLGMYMYIMRRAITIIVDVPNEDALYEAVSATWIAFKTYPTVSPVVSADEFPALLGRAGLTLPGPAH